MSHKWSRWAATGLAASVCALLVSCGGGSVVAVMHPQRIITFGDGFQDVGQNQGRQLTVNDGTANTNWVQLLASNYGLTVTPSNTGGTGYSQGYARMTTTVVDPNGTTVPSVADQVAAFVASNPFTGTDLVLIDGGMEDIVAAVEANGVSSPATSDAVNAAADALVNQVGVLLDHGAKFVAVSGVYDLGTTPWARNFGGQGTNGTVPLSTLSSQFNARVNGGIFDLTKKDFNSPVRFVDTAGFYDVVYLSVAGTSNRNNFGVDNVTDAACTTADVLDCTQNTIQAGVDYNKWMWADDLHFTPVAQRLFSVDPDLTGNKSMWSNLQNAGVTK